jgi:hypothetical protein
VFEAFLLKDQLLSVYNTPYRKTAGSILKEWIVSALRSSLALFKEFALKFFRKRHYVPQLRPAKSKTFNLNTNEGKFF